METQIPEEEGTAVSELVRDEKSRKNFLRMVGTTGAAGALAVVIAACGDDDKKTTSTSAAKTSGTAKRGSKAGDIKIVNYALTLEFLEADFYKQVVASGAVKTKAYAELAKKIGENEQAHVEALTAAVKSLGGTPVTAPKTAFEDVLAGGEKKILATAAVVENLGASAYLGQAGAINSKDILAAALSIHTVEARHAAALNTAIGAGFKGDGPLNGTLPDGAFAKPMTMDAVLAAAKPFIAS